MSTPNIYHRWTNEEVQREALLYNFRAEFQKNSSRAYKVAYKRKILDIVCSHMEAKYVDWSFESLSLEALMFATRTEFQNNSPAYQVALRRGFLDQICSHMEPSKTKPYTVEELKAIALEFKTKKEFQRNSVGAYEASLHSGQHESVCGHMPEYTRIGESNPAFKWTLEMLLAESKKYPTRTRFAKGSPDAYTAAQKRSLLDSVCSHMKGSGTSSIAEIELFAIIKKIFFSAKKIKDRKVNIENKSHIKGFDLDIYVPELNLAIEFDGTYWHSFEGLKRSRKSWSDEDIRNYHGIKDKWFETKGIKILHIKEEDWIADKQACIKRCLDFLGGSNEHKIA